MRKQQSAGTGKRGAAVRTALLILCLAVLPGTAASAAAQEAEENSAPILIDGEEARMTSYVIKENTYTRLRDIGDALGFDVEWDAENRVITVSTERLRSAENRLSAENRTIRALCIALGAALCAVFAGILIRRRRTAEPLKRLIALAGAEETQDAEAALREEAGSVAGLPGEAANALLQRSGALAERYRSELSSANAKALVLAQRSVTEEICRSTIPQPLEKSPESAALSVAGDMSMGEGADCTFYDYFFPEKGRLCFVIGQVSGSDVGDALYMVVAQTTIRSRLRMGRSLTETMSDANTQLYDLGRRQGVSALVGIINTDDGSVAYVNAGGTVPLILRSGARYEWYEGPVFAPLGRNERVSYRQETLRLRQGDRFFLYTEGLADARSAEGTPFKEKELRIALNRSRGKTDSPAELVRFVRDEALAYCETDADLPGYSALALEYRRGTGDLAFCELPASPLSAPSVTAFLRHSCLDNALPAKSVARLLVIADELFALCCRKCVKGGERDEIRVECAVAPDGELLTVRMSAALAGNNPLTDAQGDADRTVSEFIHKSAEFIRFQAGAERDTLTVVYPLAEKTPGQAAREPEKAKAEAPPPKAAPPAAKAEGERVSAPERSGSGKSLVMALRGRLDANSAPSLERELSASLDGVEELVLDLSELAYVSSAGLRVFLKAHQAMARQGRMALRNVNEDVRDILDITGFSELLNLE